MGCEKSKYEVKFETVSSFSHHFGPKRGKIAKMPESGLLRPQYHLWHEESFHLTTNLMYQTRNRIRKAEVVLKLQKMAQNDIKPPEMWTAVQHSRVMMTMCFWQDGRRHGSLHSNDWHHSVHKYAVFPLDVGSPPQQTWQIYEDWTTSKVWSRPTSKGMIHQMQKKWQGGAVVCGLSSDLANYTR